MEAPDRDRSRTKFEKNEQVYERLAEEVKFILEHELSKAGLKYHSVSKRVKKFNSFWDKAQRKKMPDPFAMTDIVGLRVVCLFLSDLKKVGALIQEAFEIISEDDKVEGQDPASFGYMSLHYDLKLKKTYSGARYDQLVGLPCEIQVRTIAMDAWAATSHYLDYKSEHDVPKELRKDFFALSGLFYIADQHFEMFFKSRMESRKIIAQDLKKEPTGSKVELNLDTLQEYLKFKFPDREHTNAKGASELVTELNQAGYRTIEEIEKVIDKASEAVVKLERETQPDIRLIDEGFVRVALDLCDEQYFANRTVPDEHEDAILTYRKFLKT